MLMPFWFEWLLGLSGGSPWSWWRSRWRGDKTRSWLFSNFILCSKTRSYIMIQLLAVCDQAYPPKINCTQVMSYYCAKYWILEKAPSILHDGTFIHRIRHPSPSVFRFRMSMIMMDQHPNKRSKDDNPSCKPYNVLNVAVLTTILEYSIM